jgi:hypothetical protein
MFVNCLKELSLKVKNLSSFSFHCSIKVEFKNSILLNTKSSSIVAKSLIFLFLEVIKLSSLHCLFVFQKSAKFNISASLAYSNHCFILSVIFQSIRFSFIESV